MSFWENLSADYAHQATGNPTFFSTRLGGDNTFDVQLSAAGLHADIGNGSGGAWLTTAADASASLAVGAWNMITYSVSSSGYTIYVNGNQVSSGAYSGSPQLMRTTSTLSIGSDANANPNSVTGMMDEVNIFSTALSALQVQGLYSSVLGSVLPTTTPVTLASDGTLDLQRREPVDRLAQRRRAGQRRLGHQQRLDHAGHVGHQSGRRLDHLQRHDQRFRPLRRAVSVTKMGAGTQVLAGANNYNGNTTILGGTLRVANTSGSATGFGSVIVGDGANPATLAGSTVALQGSIAGSVEVKSGATISAASGASLTIGNGLTLDGGSFSSFALSADGEGNATALIDVTNGSLVVTGVHTVGLTGDVAAGTYDLFSFNGTAPSILSFNLANTLGAFDEHLQINGQHLDLVVSGTGVTAFWNNNGNGLWSDDSKWSPATHPTAPDKRPPSATATDSAARRPSTPPP